MIIKLNQKTENELSKIADELEITLTDLIILIIGAENIDMIFSGSPD